jgi:hypothetical protein
MNQKAKPTSQHKRNTPRRTSASDWAISSHGSSSWSLEKAMDDLLNDNISAGSGPHFSTEHDDSPEQFVQPAQSNANNPTLDNQTEHSAFTQSYRCNSEPFAAFNKHQGRSEAEENSQMQKGINISGIKSYGVDLEKKLRIHQQCKENCCHDDLVGSGQNYDPILFLQKRQIRNYSSGNYTLDRQVYFNGAAHTNMLLSDSIKSREETLNTEMPTAAISEFPYHQTFARFNRLSNGRAIRGSAAGLDAVPVTCTVTNDTAGNQNLSFEKCMPGIISYLAKDGNAANAGDTGLWGYKHDKAVRPECLPVSNSDNVLFVNSVKTGNSLSLLGGKQEVLPASADTREVGMMTPTHVSGTLYRNVGINVNNNSKILNAAPHD